MSPQHLGDKVVKPWAKGPTETAGPDHAKDHTEELLAEGSFGEWIPHRYSLAPLLELCRDDEKEMETTITGRIHQHIIRDVCVHMFLHPFNSVWTSVHCSTPKPSSPNPKPHTPTAPEVPTGLRWQHQETSGGQALREFRLDLQQQLLKQAAPCTWAHRGGIINVYGL